MWSFQVGRAGEGWNYLIRSGIRARTQANFLLLLLLISPFANTG